MEEIREIKENSNFDENKDSERRSDKRSFGSKSGGSGSKRNFRSNRSSKNFYFRKKVCYFCKNKEAEIDYKDVGLMKRFVAESFKISPRRFTGTCAKHQRKLVKEIKKARQMALIPYLDN